MKNWRDFVLHMVDQPAVSYSFSLQSAFLWATYFCLIKNYKLK